VDQVVDGAPVWPVYDPRTTNGEMWERRRFLGSAAAGAAGLALAACGSGTKSFGKDTQKPSGTATTLPSKADLRVWRLSTRNQRAPCTACKAHAAHRYYTSAEAAGANRAHPGCTCEIREQAVTQLQYDAWFSVTGRAVFDDRT
jgi:hypothetical protein